MPNDRAIFKDYLFIFREKVREEGREGKHPCERETAITCLTDWDPTHSPGMCLDRESNWRPFTLQEDAQPTEPHWSGLFIRFLCPN